MRDLTARKQLLITESEINRLLLKEGGRALAREVHDFSQRAGQLRGLVTVALAAFSAFHAGTAAPPAGKRSWFGSIVNTVRLGTSLWSTFRNGKGREQAASGR